MSSRREDRERERRSFPERRERASNRAPRDYYNNDRTGQKYPRELINEMCAREQLRREAEGEIPWSKGEKNFRNGYYAKLKDEMDKIKPNVFTNFIVECNTLVQRHQQMSAPAPEVVSTEDQAMQ